MALAVVYSRASIGIDAPLITIEVHLANGLPAFNLVGLPEASVREAKDRVRSAMLNSGFEFPAKRITVNLAPADLPKEGGRFDLAIAIGIIAANGQFSHDRLQQFEFAGELALSGQLRPITAALPFMFACQRAGRMLVLPAADAASASLINQAKIIAAESLLAVFHHINGQRPLGFYQHNGQHRQQAFAMDMQDVIGQPFAKRAMEVAAAGGHNILLCGPPGSGKSMLAQRLITLLPLMTEEQALETATLHSIVGKEVDPSRWRQRVVRQPHHTCSGIALVGGGSIPRPGEISLAHNGVLFLDELPEFERRVLDVLREPLETGKIRISRAAHQACFPACFQLVAAMNPSPTGSLDDGRSSHEQIMRYLNKISGPFLDRIDMQIDVPAIPLAQFSWQKEQQGDSSWQIRQRVNQARQKQVARAGKLNSELVSKEVWQHIRLTVAEQAFMHRALECFGLSMRAYQRVLKVARTLADLEGEAKVNQQHLAEALNYRAFDRLLANLNGQY